MFNFTPEFGISAGTKILDAVLDGLNLPSNSALFIIDVNPGVGNLFDAYVAKRPTVNFNLQYVGMMPDGLTAEWFNETKARGLFQCFDFGMFSGYISFLFPK